MFKVSMSKDPAISLLYSLIAAASILLAISHYIFGHYQSLFFTMMSIGIYVPGAIFLFLNRDPAYSKYTNILILASIATVIQYQLTLAPFLTIHLAFAFPILSYFVLPIRWAVILNISFMLCTALQIIWTYQVVDSIRLILIYEIIGTSALCYSYINRIKRRTLLNLAVTDYQSGAYNNRHLNEKLQQEIARSSVTKRTLSLLAITIEDYQQILEIHGSATGETLLKSFHNKIKVLLRAGDDVFHNGKGTFFILSPNCPIEGAMVLKDRLFNNLNNLQWQDAGDIQLNATYSTLNPSENAEQFLHRASEHLVKQQETSLRLLAFDN